MTSLISSFPTSFIGRNAELEEIGQLLNDPACRLITLVGPGGIGKTRLAAQAAMAQQSTFADGVFFIALQPVSSVDFVIPAIAEALRLSFQAQAAPREQLLDFLSSHHCLLVLDNFEHLLESAELLAEIIARAPDVRLLVTSREILNLQEEWIRHVPGLRIPEHERDEAIEQYSAVQLFVDRARRVQADFSLTQDQDCVARICRLVGGMPLALEMAAAWLKLLSCEEIAGEIQRSLDFLATSLRNMPERHRSMRAVFDQSWQHLRTEDQEIFKHLSIFQGGFDRQAAQAVAGAQLSTLQALIDHSLLSLSAANRYHIHPLLRQFALERLDENSQDRESAQDAHCSYFMGFLHARESRLKGAEQMQALAEIDMEIDNLRAAWRWAVERKKSAEIQAAMNAWILSAQMRSRFVEAIETFERAAARFVHLPELHSSLLLAKSWFTASTDARDTLEQTRAAFIALKNTPEANPLAFLLITFCFHHQIIGIQEVRSVLQARLETHRAAGDRWSEAWALYALGMVARELHVLEEARVYLEGSLEIFRHCGDRWGSTWALHAIGGDILLPLGAYLEARPYFLESLEICRAIGDPGGVSFALHFLGEIAIELQEHQGSREYLLDALRIDIEREAYMARWHLFDIARSFAAVGQLERAVELFAFLNVIADDKEEEEYVRPHLERAKDKLPWEVFAAAQQRGEAATLQGLFLSLTNELSIPEKPPVNQPQRLPDQAGAAETLSPRELEVLRLVAAGLSNREIAHKIVTTTGTVKKHLNNIFGKLQVTSRTQAIARARDLHLLE